MKAEEFAKRLDDLENEFRTKIVELVNDAQKDEGFDWDTEQRLSFYDDPTWQRRADSIAELAGWIYDRVNGMTRLDKKSVTKKIRKALGYTYP